MLDHDSIQPDNEPNSQQGVKINFLHIQKSNEATRQEYYLEEEPLVEIGFRHSAEFYHLSFHRLR